MGGFGGRVGWTDGRREWRGALLCVVLFVAGSVAVFWCGDGLSRRLVSGVEGHGMLVMVLVDVDYVV